jgi:hypothetical protein
VLSYPIFDLPSTSKLYTSLTTINDSIQQLLTLLTSVITGPETVKVDVIGSVGVTNFDFLPLDVVVIVPVADSIRNSEWSELETSI